MRGPTCPNCLTESSVERGDALLCTKTIDLIIGEIFSKGLTYCHSEDEEGVTVILHSCYECHRRRAAPDRPHTIEVKNFKESQTHTYSDLTAAEKAFRELQNTTKHPTHFDTVLTLRNALREVLGEVKVDNGNPDQKTWNSKYAPFTVEVTWDWDWERTNTIKIDSEDSAYANFESKYAWAKAAGFICHSNPRREGDAVTVSVLLLGREGYILQEREFTKTRSEWLQILEDQKCHVVWEGARNFQTNSFLKYDRSQWEYWEAHARKIVEQEKSSVTLTLRNIASGEVLERLVLEP
jgi:hypothetical protein